jgi:hypothetical protein
MVEYWIGPMTTTCYTLMEKSIVVKICGVALANSPQSVERMQLTKSGEAVVRMPPTEEVEAVAKKDYKEAK